MREFDSVPRPVGSGWEPADLGDLDKLAALAGVTRDDLESGAPDDILELRAELTMRYAAYQEGARHDRTYSLESGKRTAVVTISRDGDYQMARVNVLLGNASEDERVVCSTLSKLVTLAIKQGVALREVASHLYYEPPTHRGSNTGVLNELCKALSTLLEEEAELDPDSLRRESICPVCVSLLAKGKSPRTCFGCGYTVQQ